jgi:hypothetical protein
MPSSAQTREEACNTVGHLDERLLAPAFPLPVLEQISRNYEPLNFAGAIKNPKSARVPEETFHCRPPDDAKSAKDLDCLIDNLEGGFGRIQLGNRSFTRDALLGCVVLPSGSIDQERSSIHSDRHVGKLALDQLVLGERLSESRASKASFDGFRHGASREA